MHAYVDALEFHGMALDEAIRRFLEVGPGGICSFFWPTSVSSFPKLSL